MTGSKRSPPIWCGISRGAAIAAKAMFVAIDKATAIRMYNKVRRYWAEMLAREAKRSPRPPMTR